MDAPPDALRLILPFLGKDAFRLIRACKTYYCGDFVRLALRFADEPEDLGETKAMAERFPELAAALPRFFMPVKRKDIVRGNLGAILVCETSPDVYKTRICVWRLPDFRRVSCHKSTDGFCFSPSDAYVLMLASPSTSSLLVRLSDFTCLRRISRIAVGGAVVDDGGMMYIHAAGVMKSRDLNDEEHQLHTTVRQFQALPSGVAVLTFTDHVALYNKELTSLRIIESNFIVGCAGRLLCTRRRGVSIYCITDLDTGEEQGSRIYHEWWGHIRFPYCLAWWPDAERPTILNLATGEAFETPIGAMKADKIGVGRGEVYLLTAQEELYVAPLVPINAPEAVDLAAQGGAGAAL